MIFQDAVDEGRGPAGPVGHRSAKITTHDSAVDLLRLIGATESVCDRHGNRPDLVVLRSGVAAGSRKVPPGPRELHTVFAQAFVSNRDRGDIQLAGQWRSKHPKKGDRSVCLLADDTMIRISIGLRLVSGVDPESRNRVTSCRQHVRQRTYLEVNPHRSHRRHGVLTELSRSSRS